jgi:hypothetical protein
MHDVLARRVVDQVYACWGGGLLVLELQLACLGTGKILIYCRGKGRVS